MIINALNCTVRITQLEELCDSYERYCGGVRDSIRLLVELKRTDAGFAQFLTSSQSNTPQLTMSSFIKKPIEVLSTFGLCFCY